MILSEERDQLRNRLPQRYWAPRLVVAKSASRRENSRGSLISLPLPSALSHFDVRNPAT